MSPTAQFLVAFVAGMVCFHVLRLLVKWRSERIAREKKEVERIKLRGWHDA